MRLRDLARETDTSEASIKYYLREGLLPPGRVVNARLSEYDETHVARLRLIGGLRSIVGASISDLAALVRRIDDPTVSLFELLGDAQRLGLGLAAADAGSTEVEPRIVTELIDRRGWGSEAVAVRRELAAHVAQMIDFGIPVTLERYAQAADVVARADIGEVTAVDSRDEAALRTAVGSHSFGHLWLRLLAVAQASHANAESTQA